MATDLEPAIQAQLDGAVVRCAVLTEFHFLSGIVRLWPGFGPLVIDGQTWSGIASMGSRTAVGSNRALAVEEITYTLFADDTVLQHFADEDQEANGQEVFDYLQFFDDDWQPLGDAFQIFWGVMGPLTVRFEPAQVGEQARRIISVSAQSALVNRRRPAYAFYTETDQQARHSGDNIFVDMSQVKRKVIWPKFT